MKPMKRILLLSQCSHRSCPSHLPSLLPRRNASFYVDPRRISNVDQTQFTGQSKSPDQQDRRLTQFTVDEQIPTALVQVKDAGSNKLSEPQSLLHLLKDIDRKSHVVNQLAGPEGREFSIVEIVEKDELRRRVKAREDMVEETQKAMKAKKPKQIELNWAIAGNDLQLKLKQLQQFLEKGRKVEILLAARRHARKATPEEGQQVIRAVHNKIEEIGAKELKPMEGKILGQALMVVSKHAS